MNDSNRHNVHYENDMSDNLDDGSSETVTETSSDGSVPRNDRDSKTVLTQRAIAKQRRAWGMYAFVAFCGLVTLMSVLYSYSRDSVVAAKLHSNIMGANGTNAVRNVSSQSGQRSLKLVDASRCRRDQIRMEGDIMVTAGECTVITYDNDGAK